MTTRATPFGLFSAYSIGAVGNRSVLAVPARSSVVLDIRPDTEALVRVGAALAVQFREHLPFRTNTTLYRVEDEWRYIEERDSAEMRERALVRVTRTKALDYVIHSAADGSRFDVLADGLRRHIGVSAEAATRFLGQLVDAGLLVCQLAPTLTGGNALDHMMALARSSGSTALQGRVHEIDAVFKVCAASGVRTLAHHLRGVKSALHDLWPGAIEQKVAQIDARLPAPELALGWDVVDTVAKAVGVLHAIAGGHGESEALVQFRERFRERYGEREIPLMEALDEDSGIGFDTAHGIDDPLIADFGVGAVRRGTVPGRAFEPRDAYLLLLLEQAWRQGSAAMELCAEDVAALARPAPLPLADSLTALAIVSAASQQALESGSYEVFVRSVFPGMGLLARFCRGDAELGSQVRAVVASDAARCADDAVLAEIVHLPQERTGNVVSRPALADYDIPFLGASGLPPERQLCPSDLELSVIGNEVVLRSRRLGRRVLPRLTCAHHWEGGNAAIYRFLCTLQHQGRAGHLAFSWGPFSDAAQLPRVVFGKAVLALASWRIDPDAKSEASLRDRGSRRAEIDRLRQLHGLPRWVQVGDGDNLLALDLDHPLCADAFATHLLSNDRDRVQELFPTPDRLCLSGPEGRFSHELILPFVNEARRAPRSEGVMRSGATEIRRYPPGTSWVYLKLYGAPGANERTLRASVAPWVAALRKAGLVDRWHFVRYQDPEDHLRVRLRCCDERPSAAMRDAIDAQCRAWCDGKAVWRVQLDTFDPEPQRYGGEEGLHSCEAIFDASSDLVLELARATNERNARWIAALIAADAVLGALSIDEQARHDLVARGGLALRSEFVLGTPFEKKLSARWRAHRNRLEQALATGVDPGAPGGAAALAAFRRAIAAPSAALAAAGHGGRLLRPLESIASSLLHMHFNRVFVSQGRAQEFIVLSLLERSYRSRLARAVEVPAA